jgi:hypothetical protein
MEVLLSYLFDPAALQGNCREDWLKVYDKEVRKLAVPSVQGGWGRGGSAHHKYSTKQHCGAMAGRTIGLKVYGKEVWGRAYPGKGACCALLAMDSLPTCLQKSREFAFLGCSLVIGRQTKRPNKVVVGGGLAGMYACLDELSLPQMQQLLVSCLNETHRSCCMAFFTCCSLLTAPSVNCCRGGRRQTRCCRACGTRCTSHSATRWVSAPRGGGPARGSGKGGRGEGGLCLICGSTGQQGV